MYAADRKLVCICFSNDEASISRNKPGVEAPATQRIRSGALESFQDVASRRIRDASEGEVRSADMERNFWVEGLVAEFYKVSQHTVQCVHCRITYSNVFQGFLEVLTIAGYNNDIGASTCEQLCERFPHPLRASCDEGSLVHDQLQRPGSWRLPTLPLTGNLFLLLKEPILSNTKIVARTQREIDAQKNPIGMISLRRICHCPMAFRRPTRRKANRRS